MKKGMPRNGSSQHIASRQAYAYLGAFLLLSVTGLLSCARQSAPTGGPKDTTPPAVDSLHSTPNFATHFKPRKIELSFDEWITLSDATNQVVVSPPLAKRPEVSLRGKKVIVQFDEKEILHDSTTYTINFGSAVKDFHEGNVAKDLRFVFSTGDFIDSLHLGGRVVDALTGNPLENISVLLYDNYADTAFRKARPYYFSRTDKNGVFDIRNLRAGHFRLLALEDGDQNLRWDGENERIAFADSLVQPYDSSRTLLLLKLFKNQSHFRITGKNTGSFGQISLRFSAPTDSADIAPEAVAGLKWLPEKAVDSMILWYDLDPPIAWKLRVNRDTLPIRALSREDFLKQHYLRFADDAPPSTTSRKILPGQTTPDASQPVKTIPQNPAKPLELHFNFPVVALDTSKWELWVDSLATRKFSLSADSLFPRQVTLRMNWEGGKTYRLYLLPGALTDLWGKSNTDTLRRIIAVPEEKQLGGLHLTLENLIPGRHYVFQLLNGTAVEQERFFMAARDKYELTFTRLTVALYTAKLIEDWNENGRWDTGDYWKHRQPEPVFSKKLQALRANWDMEATMTTNTDGDTPIKKSKKKE